ncbi:MAG: UDPGP type 1 family protein [Phycisphaerales bacterium]|nr:UDPGP type 1 family protein [Phycisphaerales bacterium]
MADITDIRTRLQACGQEHLLGFWDELDQNGQETLLEQIDTINLEQLQQYIEKFVASEPVPVTPDDITPAVVLPRKPANDEQKDLYQRAIERGNELLAEGKVAACVVAGGQGTRLGFDGPKGSFQATPVAKKPLFQVFAEQIQAASLRAGKPIPWYIMTSRINDTQTKAFLRRNNYFGLDPKNVRCFRQGTMPAIGLDGKLLLAKKGTLAVSPDGHGGILPALRDSGSLDDMDQRGVTVISYFQVDNPMVKCIDPLFIGLHDLNQAEMSAKALAKRDPMEKLGNFCVVDGKTSVIEYSDMPEDLARSTNDQGFLKFSAGSIAIHILSRSFVQRLTEGQSCSLPFHRAEKAVRHIDASGTKITPSEPNAVKLEMFIFDAMPLADKTVILETRRSEEFSPIKNAEGLDSPITCLHHQVRRAANWLKAAGVELPLDAEGQTAAAIEISPLFADSAEELAKKIDPSLTITGGQQLYLGSRGQIGGAR